MTGTWSHRNQDDLLLPTDPSFRKTSGNCWPGFGPSHGQPLPPAQPLPDALPPPPAIATPEHRQAVGQAGGGDERPALGRASDGTATVFIRYKTTRNSASIHHLFILRLYVLERI